MTQNKSLYNKMLDHPYVKMIMKDIADKSIFTMSPNDLAEKRLNLLREHLKYLNDQSGFYSKMFKNIGISPTYATIEDIVKLAVSCNQWRGEGVKKYLLPHVQQLAETAERKDDKEKYGKWFRSSGTTGQEPLRMYRSPIDLKIQELTTISMADNLLDSKTGGCGLILAAPEMKNDYGFIFGIEIFLKERGAEILWGMRVDETVKANSIFEKLRPEKKAIARFLKSKAEPKIILSAPMGIWQMLRGQIELNKQKGIKGYFANKMSGLGKAIDLGKGGAIITGGGTKSFDIPPFDELLNFTKDKILARDENGNQVPAPWIDILSQTENITALASCSQWNDGKLKTPASIIKTPHPLAEVLLIDPRTHKILGPGQEGEFLHYNPYSLSLLEAFFPGDIGRSYEVNNYYGQGFEFVRRLKVNEGGIDRACGGSMEEMMKAHNEGVEDHAA